MRYYNRNRLTDSLLGTPSRSLLAGFLLLISVGTGILYWGHVSTDSSLSFIDALFMSTSASCVTGLSVIGIQQELNTFGQILILALIQIGGLGIMTISTLFLLLAGKKPGFTGQLAIRNSFTHTGDQSVSSIITHIFGFVISFEIVGCIILFFAFRQDHEIGQSAYLAVFHSISAFCNAGFSLFSNSLTAYRGNWLINATIAFLIISGGLGFLVFSELRKIPENGRFAWKRLSLHSKIVLSSTIFLLVGSTLLIAVMEWDNTLQHLSTGERFLASFFQATSARTAGFNTLPIVSMTNEALFLLVILMFIGACPGSCAGGVKLTTVSTLIAMGISRFRGREYTQLFRRTIPKSQIEKAINVVLISAFFIFLSVMLLLMSELGEMSHISSRGKFMELLFEAVSAFGTVGLSTGLTPTLSVTGKLIIIFMMFIGRLGPLTIILAISKQYPVQYYYAEENIMIG